MVGIHYSSLQYIRIFFLQLSHFSPYTTRTQSKHDFFGDQITNSFATCILDAKYEQANVHDAAFDQTHLLLDQQSNLFNVLSKQKKLFDGSLGVYPHKKVHIDLKPGAKPVHDCAYPVPHVH